MKRIEKYLRAIENDTTEAYHDIRDFHKNRISGRELLRRQGRKPKHIMRGEDG